MVNYVPKWQSGKHIFGVERFYELFNCYVSILTYRLERYIVDSLVKLTRSTIFSNEILVSYICQVHYLLVETVSHF